ncbi:MAG: biotin/lipoyl-binding protein, partial [Gemmatimonadales bacterium]
MSLVSAAVVLAAAACTKPPARPPRAPVTVTVTPVRRMSIPYTVEANGIVTPLQTASVASQVDGIVTDVLFQEGQEVGRGQTLFKIDPRPYQATYQQVQATLA